MKSQSKWMLCNDDKHMHQELPSGESIATHGTCIAIPTTAAAWGENANDNEEHGDDVQHDTETSSESEDDDGVRQRPVTFAPNMSAKVRKTRKLGIVL